ncbi:MAG: DUF192 domain-containing protein [Hyphomicrobium sp.]
MAGSTTSRRAALLAALLVCGGAYVVSKRPPAREQAAAGLFRKETLDLVTAGGRRTLTVEMAVSTREQAQGLMFRTSLADTEGMLFVHPAPTELRMWMRNTYIPLDMVFIRPDGTVHRIAARTEPLSDDVIVSNGEVIAVLELAGGAAGRLGLAVGDRVEHAHFRGSQGAGTRK